MTQNENSFIGVGLRSPHYSFLEQEPNLASLSQEKNIHWFEALSENYMQTEGRPLEVLLKVRKYFPMALHGVGLSIGSHTGLSQNYLQKLKGLAERTDPFLISDHLCWTGLQGQPTHDLLPLPYTEEAIQLVCSHLNQVQDFLGQPIALENVSSYLRFKTSEMSEWEFIAEIQKRSGCHLLLDLNNVYVNSQNHHFDPKDFIDHIPLSAVKQMHLAGHTKYEEFLFDTHSDHVCQEVWELLKYTKNKMQNTPAILVEWDDNIPNWDILVEEALQAKKIWEEKL